MSDEKTGLDVASVGDAEGVAAPAGLDAPALDMDDPKINAGILAIEGDILRDLLKRAEGALGAEKARAEKASIERDRLFDAASNLAIAVRHQTQALPSVLAAMERILDPEGAEEHSRRAPREPADTPSMREALDDERDERMLRGQADPPSPRAPAGLTSVMHDAAGRPSAPPATAWAKDAAFPECEVQRDEVSEVIGVRSANWDGSKEGGQ